MSSSERQLRWAAIGDETKKQLVCSGRAPPDYVEPTPVEWAENMRTLEAEFVEHGCLAAD